MDDQQKHLAELFAKLMDTPDHDDRERMIEDEACRHKESIRELAQENADLKLALWEYENNYRMGVKECRRHGHRDTGRGVCATCGTFLEPWEKAYDFENKRWKP